MTKQKIVVLGGSFNPPTIAHKKLLSTAIETLQADIGLFVPSSDQYVSRKMSRQKTHNTVYSEITRLQMLQTICTDKMQIDTTEYGDDGRGHTYDTLVKIQKKYPNAEIIFIVGADKLHIMPRWHSHDELFRNFYFGVATRNTDGTATVQKIIKNTPKLKAFEDHFYMIQTTEEMSDVSSSIARNYICTKQWNKLTNILTPETVKIIKSL